MGRWYLISPGTLGTHELCHQQAGVTTPHTPVFLPAQSKHSPAWPVVRPHSYSPSQPGPRDLHPCGPSGCDPTAPGPSCATGAPSQGTAVPSATRHSPSRGTERPRCQTWEQHPWHCQSRGSLLGAFPEPSSRHGPSSPAATRVAGGSGRDQGPPSHAKDSSTAWAVGESSHVSWKSIS